jgi:glycosyltransferase involved in cell wall biosynthesis
LRIAVVTLSSLAYDSRVQRTCAALTGAGHKVRLIGRPPAPRSGEVAVTLLPAGGGALATRFGLIVRQAPAQILPATAPALYWIESARRAAFAETLAFQPQLVVANDWNTLPIAARVKAQTGARVLYDSHEFAPTEFADRRLWRLLARRHVEEIEARFIAAADAVTTVSANIAGEIAARYRLPVPPVVLRNIPDFEPRPARPTGDVVTVLFHGLLRAHRGLEPLIDSVTLWRPERRLVLRGYGADGYVGQLRTRAESSVAAGRIAFEPPVAPEQVVPAAAAADIGFFALPGSSPQSRFALPNKIFEYIGAALAVVTTPLADMRALLDQWGCGAYTGESASEIASSLNALDRAAVDRLKSRAAEAARTLNWRRESTVLLDLVAALAPK